jgi:polyisoprenoid-binding protein YceI
MYRGTSSASQHSSRAEFDKLATRALFIVEHFGVVNASFGGRVQKLLGSFQRDTADLPT